MRDAEIKSLTWELIHFTKRFLAVGRSKTDAGEGRTIPLNSSLFDVLSNYAEWYREQDFQFPCIQKSALLTVDTLYSR